MYIRYLIIFLLVISCSSQHSRNAIETYNEPVFTTSKWKKLVIEELKRNRQIGANQTQLSENIEFINSKDNSFLEKKFLFSGFKNLRLKDKGSFFLINYFYKGDGYHEYTYVLQKTNNCNSYLIANDGFNQKRDVKRVNCNQKLDKINFLMNYSQNDKFTPVKGMLILWSCVEGKNQVRIYNNLTISQDDLIESIFY